MYYLTKNPIKALSAAKIPLEPKSFRLTMKDSDWHDAMKVEFNALITNNTNVLWPQSPDKTIVQNNKVFKLKQKANSSIEKYKAHHVAKV